MKSKKLCIASVTALALASCSSDELKEVYEGEEISFTTQVGRATNMTLDNLDYFTVFADADGYKTMFINNMKATKKSQGSGIFVLDKKVTWPVDVKSIRFWAYGPLPEKGAVDPEITANTQVIRNFSAPSSLTDGGAEHTDLICAYANMTRNSDDMSGMQVPLVFHHALSQVEVKIKKGSGFEEGRVVRVKGAWVVNVHSTGDLEFRLEAPDNHMLWSTRTPVTYGRQIEATPLGNATVSMISNDDGSHNSSLMVVPQIFEKVKFPDDASSTADESGSSDLAPNYNGEGTYILVLCRIETNHYTDVTPEGSAENPAIGDLKDANGKVIGHVHQLFPNVYDSKGQLIYDEKAFGYTCVPIGGEWLPGKKYVYTLEFCGSASGGGLYPPEPLPDGLPDATPRPGDKNPGNPVLDDPITFSVSVAEWTSEDKPTPMN